jgi:FkbM family methyltransferase
MHKFKSQDGQDRYIYHTFFKNSTKKNIFVDIGANDGITFSNTWFFEKELNWDGICIEPIVNSFNKCQKERSCKCYNVCAYNETKILNFLNCNGYTEMLSGVLDEYNQQHLKRIENEINGQGGSKEVIKMNAIKTQELFDDNYYIEIDYLSIDVEGSELKVLEGIDFKKTKINVISIEANYENEEQKIKNLLSNNSFIFKTRIGADLIFVNSEFHY